MSQTSPRLALPLIQPSQAQKHVTHNEAVVLLDGLVQMTLRGAGETDPPAAGADGEAWGLGPAPTGPWEGRGGMVAIRSNGGWVFAAPREGWRAWDLSSGGPLVHDGAGWVPDVPGTDNLAGVGIGTAHDATNRLSVASDAVLLSHAGAGMRLAVNKAGPAETASLLFQSDWSGRAEMGLAGSDAFEVKVSADGASWATGLRVAPSGALEAPQGLSVGGGAPVTWIASGSWTPVLTSDAPATGAQQSGTGGYVRIGAMVHAWAEVTLVDPGTGGGGAVRIEGLPAAGSGLAAGAVEADGAALPAGGAAAHVDGTAAVPGGGAGGAPWSALGAGTVVRAALTFQAS